VLFAMSVMAIGLLGVASMFPAGLRTVITGGHTSKATTLVREMVEMLQADTFANLDAYYSGFDTRPLTTGLRGDAPTFTCPVNPALPDYNKKKWACDMLGAGAAVSGQGLPGAYGTVRVDCVNPDGSINTSVPCPTELRLVTVTVTWTSQGSRSVSLVTYVAKTE
jgi:Tfp pilus assembly protein PilV